MCRAFEEYGDERVAERNVEVAKKLILQTKMSISEIAQISDLPIEQVEKIASTQRKA